MSFSDMMEGSRGPGVVGMVMALVVLAIFVLLYLFAFDEGMMGADRSIESVVTGQARKVKSLQSGIENGTRNLERHAARLAQGKEYAKLKSENLSRENHLSSLMEGVEVASRDLAEKSNEFESYKNKYRTLVRGNATGQNVERLETSKGVVYENVSIRKVTAVGILIRHESGSKRIPYEELPQKMQDHFQFDEKEKATVVSNENAERWRHEAAVSATKNLTTERNKQAIAKKLEMKGSEIDRRIAIREAQISALEAETRRLQADYSREVSRASSARIQGRVFMDRSGSISRDIQSKQNRINALRVDVARMRQGH